MRSTALSASICADENIFGSIPWLAAAFLHFAGLSPGEVCAMLTGLRTLSLRGCTSLKTPELRSLLATLTCIEGLALDRIGGKWPQMANVAANVLGVVGQLTTLRSLGLSANHGLSDLAALKSLVNLTHLDVRLTRVTSAEVGMLQTALPQLSVSAA
jgi:hypothetical protein